MQSSELNSHLVVGVCQKPFIDKHFRYAPPQFPSSIESEISHSHFLWTIIAQHCLNHNKKLPTFHQNFKAKKITIKHFIERGKKYCQENGIELPF